MKICIIVIWCLLPGALNAQLINVRLGSLNFKNPMWNSWKTSSKNSDTSVYLADVFGNRTNIRVILSNSGTPFDNLAGYEAGKGFYPDTVLREGIYQGQGIKWQIALIGLDSLTTYNVGLFASRNRIDGQSTQYSYSTVAQTFKTDTNTFRQALFNGLVASHGQIAFTVTDLYIYSYLNAITVNGVPNHSRAVAKIWQDSTVINYPNCTARLNPDSSTGVYGNAYSWSLYGGPAAPIIGKPLNGKEVGDTMYVAFPKPGTYVFRLLVQDSLGIFDSAFTSVTLNPAPPPRTVKSVALIFSDAGSQVIQP